MPRVSQGLCTLARGVIVSLLLQTCTTGRASVLSFWLERFLPRSLIYHLTTALPFLHAYIEGRRLWASTCSRYSHALFQLLNTRSASTSIDRTYDSSPCLNGTLVLTPSAPFFSIFTLANPSGSLGCPSAMASLMIQTRISSTSVC